MSETTAAHAGLRSAHGRKCAIGSLVSDDVYDPDIEGIGISYYRHARDGKLLQALYASNVNAYDPSIVELLIELEQVSRRRQRRPVAPSAQRALGRRHAFI